MIDLFHFPPFLQVGKPQLPQGLEDDHCHGIGQVQGPGLRDHGKLNAVLGVGVEKLLRQALCFLAEEEIALVVIGNLSIAAGRLGGKQPHLANLVFCKEIGQIFIDPDVQQMPVVQTRPFQLPIGNIKAQGLNQVEPAARSGAGSGDVPGILGDLRLHKDDVQHFFNPILCNSETPGESRTPPLRLHSAFCILHSAFYSGSGLVLVYSTKRKGVRPSIWVG